MFHMIGGGEFAVIAAIIAFIFGGSKAFKSVKNIKRDVAGFKDEISNIKDDIKSEVNPDLLKIRELD